MLRVLTAFCLCTPAAARKCHPETRCLNSPDAGTSELSSFSVPAGASAADRETFSEGMRLYGMSGTERCMYGHTDLEGYRLQNTSARTCPQGAGTCGWSVTNYFCTCASRELALAAYDPADMLGGAAVMMAFGATFAIVWGVQVLKDLRDGKELSPGCDFSDPGVLRFWIVLIFALALPVGLISGAAYVFSLAARDRYAPGTAGYFKGCGNFHPMAAVNLGGQILYISLATIIGGMVCFLVVYFLVFLRPGRERQSVLGAFARGRQAQTLNVRVGDPTSQAIADARSRVHSLAVGGRGAGASRPSRPMLLAQSSARRVGEVSLQLASPVRIARILSAGRLERGGGRAAEFSVRRQGSRRGMVAKARVEVHSGWMVKVLPSYVSRVVQKRFFVLYDTAELHYYESDKETSEALGKLDLSRLADEEIRRVYPQSDRDFTFRIKPAGRAAAWDCDPGDEAGWKEWEERLVPMVRGAQPRLVHAVPVTSATDEAAAESAPVVAAVAVPPVD